MEHLQAQGIFLQASWSSLEVADFDHGVGQGASWLSLIPCSSELGQHKKDQKLRVTGARDVFGWSEQSQGQVSE